MFKNKKFFHKLAVVFFCLMAVACNPLKTTDPNDPNFDVTKFSLEDYKTEESLSVALSKLFPTNTNRDSVEEVLLSYANVSASKKRGLDLTTALNMSDAGYVVIYGKKWGVGGVKTIFIEYDSTDSLQKMDVHFMGAKEAQPYLFLTNLND